MTNILSKFDSHRSFLLEAVAGDADLRSNQKLYKKICKYYKNLGVIFSGDTKLDYDRVLDCLYEDLE